MINRKTILGCKRRYHEFSVNGELCRIQSLTAREYEDAQKGQLKPDGKLSIPALKRGNRALVVKSLVDESGTRILMDEDVEALADTDSLYVNTISEEVKKLNGIKDSDEHEEAVKNSETTPEDSSPST